MSVPKVLVTAASLTLALAGSVMAAPEDSSAARPRAFPRATAPT